MPVIRLLPLLALCLGTGGCFWLAVGAEGGYVAGQKQSAGATVSDQWITTKTKSALIADGDVKARNINVDTDAGVVTLRGFVFSAHEAERAVTIARSIKGVKSVVNLLKLTK